MTDERAPAAGEDAAEAMDAADRAALCEANERMRAAIAALDEALVADPVLRALRDRVQAAMAAREQAVQTAARRYGLAGADRVEADGRIVRGE